MILLSDIQSFFRGSIRISEPLSRYTILGIGGPTDFLLSPVDDADQQMLLDYLDEKGVPHYTLRPDLLASDEGFRGVMINPSGTPLPAGERRLEMFEPVEGFSIEALINRVELHGRTWGDAEIDGAFIANRGNARASDVLALVLHAQRTIRRGTGVHLEVKFPVLGFNHPIAKVA